MIEVEHIASKVPFFRGIVFICPVCKTKTLFRGDAIRCEESHRTEPRPSLADVPRFSEGDDNKESE